MKLANAGYRDESVMTTFLASKTILAGLLAVAAATFVWTKGYPLGNAVGITMIAAGMGFLGPNLWLASAVQSRCELIRSGLPDTLDMLVISVESGLGLDAAFQRVGDEMHGVHPVISEELQLVTLESQMGIPRSEALANLSGRSGLDEMRSLVAIINQAGALWNQHRHGAAEPVRCPAHQATPSGGGACSKTTVKLMAPLILFIFPAILVVLAGPAGLKMIEALKNTPGLL